MNHLLAEQQKENATGDGQKQKLGLIVNDFGECCVDAGVLAGAVQLPGGARELASGCVCCRCGCIEFLLWALLVTPTLVFLMV